MSPNAVRKLALECIEAVVFPDGWTMADPDPYFKFQRYWWRENPVAEGSPRSLSGVRLSAQIARGAVEVSAFGMTIVCGGLQVQAAVDAVLAWEVAAREAVERAQADDPDQD